MVRQISISLLLALFCSVLFSQTPVPYAAFPKLLDSLRDVYGFTQIPLVTDLEKDGQKEIVITAGIFAPGPRVLYVIKSNGSNQPGFPKVLNAEPMDFASGDVNGDGFLDIVLRTVNNIEVFDRFGNNLPGFPVSYPTGSSFSAISLYDLDGDGKLEICTSSYTEYSERGSITVYNYNGEIRNGWPRITVGRANLGKAIGDIDNDGFAEIIATSYKQLGFPPYTDSGAINIYRHDGSAFSSNWPIYYDSNYITYSGSPSLYIDKIHPESTFIFVTTERILPNDSCQNTLTRYNIYGNVINRKYQLTFRDGLGTITMGDLNGDGVLEFASGSQWPDELTTYSNTLDILPGWPKLGYGGYFASPIIGKFKYGSNLQVFSFLWKSTNNYGFTYVYDYTAEPLIWTPHRPFGLISGMSAADLNSDGSVEIIASTNSMDKKSYLHAFTIPGIPFSLQNFPWPCYAHDRYRTNQYGFIPPDEPIGIQPLSNEIPGSFSLAQNYPNPFNASTIIKFEVPAPLNPPERGKFGAVTLKVYDILGREIAILVDEALKPGKYSLTWEAYNFSSGVYFCRLISGDFSVTRKMILIK